MDNLSVCYYMAVCQVRTVAVLGVTCIMLLYRVKSRRVMSHTGDCFQRKTARALSIQRNVMPV